MQGCFPDGPVIENLPANAEDRLDPGWGTKIPSEAGQLWWTEDLVAVEL